MLENFKKDRGVLVVVVWLWCGCGLAAAVRPKELKFQLWSRLSEKYRLGQQNFSFGSFPEVGQKQKT